MAKRNLSAILASKDNLYLENRPIPEPASNEVLIAINFVGICGSDIHFWKDGRIGDSVIYKPMVLGHEGSGTIMKIGDDVKDLKPGDRVCLEPAIPCRNCDFCTKGRYNLCPYVKGCSTPDFDGCLCEYYCFPANLCHKLPNNVSLQEGALIEPLSVAVHTCKRAGVSAGCTVLICGAGPIGLLNLLVCKAIGASKIFITDICEKRLLVAEKLGATHQICVKDRRTEDLIDEIKTKLGDAPDITIECSGAASSVNMGIRVTKSGGVYIQVGVGAAEVPIPIIDAAVREVDIKGTFRYVDCFPIALDLVASGHIKVKPLISHLFLLEDTLKAYETAYNHSDWSVKVLIMCQDA